MEEEKKKYNVFRDSLLRYAGYANEVGESFRYQFPSLVRPSYAVAFGYCLADSLSTGYSTYERYGNSGNEIQSSSIQQKEMLRATSDTLLWQCLASVVIPGGVINLVVKASRFAVARSPTVLPALVSTWLPTATGLGSIPFIIHPIDHGVDVLLDNTTRAWWPPYGDADDQ